MDGALVVAIALMALAALITRVLVRRSVSMIAAMIKATILMAAIVALLIGLIALAVVHDPRYALFAFAALVWVGLVSVFYDP